MRLSDVLKGLPDFRNDSSCPSPAIRLVCRIRKMSFRILLISGREEVLPRHRGEAMAEPYRKIRVILLVGFGRLYTSDGSLYRMDFNVTVAVGLEYRARTLQLSRALSFGPYSTVSPERSLEQRIRKPITLNNLILDSAVGLAISSISPCSPYVVIRVYPKTLVNKASC